MVLGIIPNTKFVYSLNRLRRWDFALPVSGFWHFHAKTPHGTVGSE